MSVRYSVADVRPRIGVVTVTYNTSQYLPEFFACVKSQTRTDVTLYVVDSGSTDGSASLAETADLAPVRVDVTRLECNVGVAAANNVGIRKALVDGADWILVLNNDTQFDPAMFGTLVSVAEESGAMLISPVIEAETPVGSLWYGGGRLSRVRGYRVWHPGMGQVPAADIETKKSAEKTEYAPTCCLLVAPEVFRMVGLMDPSYFVYCDDVDFAIRARRAGYDFYVTSRARMLHKASGATGGARSAFSVKWINRNRVLVARRYLSLLELPFALVYIQVRIHAAQMRWRDGANQYWLAQRWFWKGLTARKDCHSVPDYAD